MLHLLTPQTSLLLLPPLLLLLLPPRPHGFKEAPHCCERHVRRLLRTHITASCLAAVLPRQESAAGAHDIPPKRPISPSMR
jgi:hypothetical protein